ncbi:MFS transporter [Portibacter lacus]|uniref:Major facilitator superfamily (MFS) profile domain-containing protein n=1 Tax=Portibacter lacus TaxID=1099794 RepID=A0AA37SS95_9BACT|nr:MFS transporter [Portibacter lacus]GLR17886.1 hypothetical protein GCM10007940_25010 [Portibacter lacus]
MEEKFNYKYVLFLACVSALGGFLFIAMRFVDTLGRRKLMIFGALGLSIVYALISSAYYFEFKGLQILFLVVVSIGIYSMSLAPITWVVLSEIFPNRVRGLRFRDK